MKLKINAEKNAALQLTPVSVVNKGGSTTTMTSQWYKYYGLAKLFKQVLCAIAILTPLANYAAFNEPTAQVLVVDVGSFADFVMPTAAPCYPLGGWDGNGNGKWNRYTIKLPLPDGVTMYNVSAAKTMLNGDRVWEGQIFRINGGPAAKLTPINYNINRTTTQGGNIAINGDVVKPDRAVTVRVNAAPTIPVLVNQNIPAGQSKNVNLGITDPGDPNQTIITADSSNPAIVQVLGVNNNSVNLKALKPGSVTITVKANDTRLVAQAAFSVDVPNTAPNISAISPQNVNAGQPKLVNFTVFDSETSPGSLVVTASSDNQAVVPDASYVFGNNGQARTLTFTGKNSGMATITVKVSDGQLSAQSAFQVTVANSAPLITTNLPVSIQVNSSKQIAFQVLDNETPDNVDVSVLSNDPQIIPDANLMIGGTLPNMTLDINSGAATGTLTLTIKASDGQFTTFSDVQVTVVPPNQPPTLENNAAFTVNRSATKAFTPVNLKVSDVDNTAQELIYVLQNNPTNGVIKKSGEEVTSWSQADIDAGLVTYTHDGNTNSLVDSFDFQVGDQINPNIGPFTLAINILPFEEEDEIAGGDPNDTIDMILTNGLEWVTNGMPGVKELIAEKGLGYFKGKYQGLSASSPWVQETAGFFKMKYNKKGRGKVIHKKVSEKLKWKGDFNSNGVWYVERGNELFALALTTNKQVYGYITNTAGARPPSAIVANIGYYNAKKTPWNGPNRFLVKLGSETNSYGEGFVKVNKAGTAKLNLLLSDNTKAKAKAFIAQNGTWPVFKPLFNKQGSLWSFVHIKSEKGATNAVTGKAYLQDPKGLQQSNFQLQ